jgi:hypothetical protein
MSDELTENEKARIRGILSVGYAENKEIALYFRKMWAHINSQQAAIEQRDAEIKEAHLVAQRNNELIVKVAAEKDKQIEQQDARIKELELQLAMSPLHRNAEKQIQENCNPKLLVDLIRGSSLEGKVPLASKEETDALTGKRFTDDDGR